jgi:hypothetical protein
MLPTSKRRYPRGPRFKVFVTAEQIEHSKVRDSSHCMISMAVKEVVPEAKSISTDIQTIRFSFPEKGYRYTYLTPRIAQVALINFDQGILPEPFEFHLQGAHVTKMARKNVVQTPSSAKKKLSGAQKASIEKMRSVWRHDTHEHDELSRPKIANGETKRPRRVGGKTPPTTPFARRREFGLRALKI